MSKSKKKRGFSYLVITIIVLAVISDILGYINSSTSYGNGFTVAAEKTFSWIADITDWISSPFNGNFWNVLLYPIDWIFGENIAVNIFCLVIFGGASVIGTCFIFASDNKKYRPDSFFQPLISIIILVLLLIDGRVFGKLSFNYRYTFLLPFLYCVLTMIGFYLVAIGYVCINPQKRVTRIIIHLASAALVSAFSYFAFQFFIHYGGRGIGNVLCMLIFGLCCIVLIYSLWGEKRRIFSYGLLPIFSIIILVYLNSDPRVFGTIGLNYRWTALLPFLYGVITTVETYIVHGFRLLFKSDNYLLNFGFQIFSFLFVAATTFYIYQIIY